MTAVGAGRVAGEMASRLLDALTEGPLPARQGLLDVPRKATEVAPLVRQTQATRPVLTTAYGPGREPLLTVGLMANRGVKVSPTPVVFVLGCVDSGACRTLVPLSVAARLGLQANELTLDQGSFGGVGSSINTWSSSVSVLGTVMAFPRNARPAQPWGPVVDLNPGFTDLQPEPATLLGRADFFRAFVITFNEDATAPSFCIQQR